MCRLCAARENPPAPENKSMAVSLLDIIGFIGTMLVEHHTKMRVALIERVHLRVIFVL